VVYAHVSKKRLGCEPENLGAESSMRPECTHKAAKGLLQRTAHHIEDLQRAGVLPETPLGRLFPPYEFVPAEIERLGLRT
jgi:hypothetical protein